MSEDIEIGIIELFYCVLSEMGIDCLKVMYVMFGII